MLNPTETGSRENEARDAFQALQTPIRVLIVDDHAILRAGVRDVALALADDTSSRYDRLAQNDAVEVLGDLYRGLLRRNASDEQLWNEDSGFRGNVDALRRHGYERIIQTILDAPEFRSVNNLSDVGSLAGLNNNPRWRSERSRYAVRDN